MRPAPAHGQRIRKCSIRKVSVTFLIGFITFIPTARNKALKRLPTFLLILLLYHCARGQSPADNSIRIGKAEELYSKTLHEQRQILVYLPGSFYDTYFYKRRYPVVYLLDGDAHFYSVLAMIKQMSEDGGAQGQPTTAAAAKGFFPSCQMTWCRTSTLSTRRHPTGSLSAIPWAG
jgi:hypothetical protein